jgi:pimeloyl-ACP methyl ester carboxylesterase
MGNPATIGYTRLGTGPKRVIVMHDWMADTSTWEPTRPYLSLEATSWVFADLRSYGRSRGMGGPFDIERAASDIVAVADALGWDRFTVLGRGETPSMPKPRPVGVPLFAVTGELDAEPMRAEAVERHLAPLNAEVAVVPLADSGHYPMQEEPPRFATAVERLLTPGA